jgi:transcriptional regulator with XRE-family HTH domain
VASGVVDPDEITTRQEFARLLEIECLIAGISIDDLAEESGVTPATVIRWFTGRALPSATSLRRMLRAYAKEGEFVRWNNAVARVRVQPVQPAQPAGRRPARRAGQRAQDPADLLFRLYIPAERLYAAEAARLLSLFRDWMTKARAVRIRQASYRTAAGEMFEFFGTETPGTRPDLQEEFDSFADFLTLCTVDPSAAADQLAPLGLAGAAATDFVGRLGTEVRRLQVDLAQEREKRVMAIRHDLERRIVDSGVALQAVPRHQIQALIERLVPGPTAPASLALLATPWTAEAAPPVTLQINQQFINAVESQVVQNVQGTVHLGPPARQLLELIAQYGDHEKITLEASVHELEDTDAPRDRRVAAKRRLKRFVGQLVDVAHDVAVHTLEKYLESKGL